MTFDFAVIGGGIVGLATAAKLLETRPGSRVLLLEKESIFGVHQTGHNSGVIHSGIYYKPGSLKATLCRQGAQATRDFCKANEIVFETCGKLLVATNEGELGRMEALFERAGQNGIEIERLSAAALSRREPMITGLGALFVKETGIVDYRRVVEAMGRRILREGGTVELAAQVDSIDETGTGVTIAAGKRRWRAERLIACAGLQSDRIAAAAGLDIDYRIVPFRGEYYRLPAKLNGLICSLIYPIPDPELPFLGIHLTRMIDGSVTVGPNAVLGFSREGYPRFSFNARDVGNYVQFPGFWRLIRSNLKSGISEMRNSIWKSGYLEQCRKYCPSLRLQDLLPHVAGIRAQAVRRDGSLVEDFLFLETPRMLHVCNAPSPAATSAIPIASTIVDRCIERA
jgi:L-2-hydroxyglutarate oxidase